MNDPTRRLLLWNWIWLTLSAILALSWAFNQALSRLSEDVSRVRTSWDGPTLRLSTTRGGVAILYLHSHLGAVPVAARLATPLFILDSGPVRVEPAVWKTLE